MVFVGWRRALRSPTDEHNHLNQSGINMDWVDRLKKFQIRFAVNVGLHFVQHQPTIFNPTYEINNSIQAKKPNKKINYVPFWYRTQQCCTNYLDFKPTNSK